MRGSIVLISMLLFCHDRLVAQETTGDLRGRVTFGASGVAGATVTISGPHLLGTKQTVSAGDGVFQIRLLPPGVYMVRLVAVGYRPVTMQQIEVVLGKTIGLGDIVLETARVFLSDVVIIAPRVSLDPSRTDIGTTLTSVDYKNLPGDRDYKSMMAILPFANVSYRGDPINVGGSTGLENVYFIDGVNVTSPWLADNGTSLPHNFLRAVEVKTGGYDAQFGRALGAVVNAVTYSGTNTFESDVFAFASGSGLSASPRREPTLSSKSSISYDVGARIGGPIIRDRLWYSAAYNPRIDRTDREIGGHGVFEDKRIAHIFAAKASFRTDAGSRIEASVFGDPTRHRRVAVPDASPGPSFRVLNPDPYLLHIETGGITTSLRGTTTFGSRILLEGSVASYFGVQIRQADTEVGRTQPWFVDFTDGDGAFGGGADYTNRNKLRRAVGMIRATVPFSTITSTIGAEYEDALVNREERIASVTRAPDFSWWIYNSDLTPASNHNRVPAVYSQNSWRFGNEVTLNAGLRWSRQSITGTDNKVAQSYGNEWQPRLGIIWRQKDGGQRAFASYGRFYQQQPLNLATIAFHPSSDVTATYASDPRVPGAQLIHADTTHYEGIGAGNKRLPNVASENVDELTVGYERMMGKSSVGTIRIIHRNLRSAVQWAFPTPFEIALGTPGQGKLSFLPSPVRRFTGLELSFNGSWRETVIRSSYVLSRNWGNYSGLYDSDITFAYPGYHSVFLAPYHAVNSTGYLPNDRTHVLKFSASRALIGGFTGGAVFDVESGSPITAFGSPEAPWSYNWYAFSSQRGSAGRTPSLWNLDFRLTWQRPGTHRTQPRLTMDILHVGNPQREVRVDELKYRANNGGVFSDPNPTYGQPLFYQPPTMIRLGLEMTR